MFQSEVMAVSISTKYCELICSRNILRLIFNSSLLHLDMVFGIHFTESITIEA